MKVHHYDSDLAIWSHIHTSDWWDNYSDQSCKWKIIAAGTLPPKALKTRWALNSLSFSDPQGSLRCYPLESPVGPGKGIPSPLLTFFTQSTPSPSQSRRLGSCSIPRTKSWKHHCRYWYRDILMAVGCRLYIDPSLLIRIVPTLFE